MYYNNYNTIGGICMYPDWATKYKRPGTILRKKNDNSYLLFSAHSERQKGKK